MPVQTLHWRRLWLGLGWAMATSVVYLSLIPNPPEPLAVPFADKVEHASAFAWLALWFLQIVDTRHRVHVAAALLLLGVAIEVAQSFTPTRMFELADIAADAAGITIGAGLARTGLGSLLAGIERRLVSRILNHERSH